ncbi:MAG: hypothetical protein ACI4RF_03905, partial [Eubacterium sp.]
FLTAIYAAVTTIASAAGTTKQAIVSLLKIILQVYNKPVFTLIQAPRGDKNKTVLAGTVLFNN